VKKNYLPDDIIGPRKPPNKGHWRTDPYSAPLKANALRTLRPELSALGFAASGVQRRATFLRYPIYWIYRDSRASRPFRYYESVGAVTVPCLPTEERMTFAPTSTCIHWPVFSQFFDRFLGNWEPGELFSDEGLAEIRGFMRAAQAGKRRVDSQKLMRYQWVRHHPELWDAPAIILANLRQYGLYKTSTPDCQALEYVQLMIERVKNGESPEELLPKEKKGPRAPSSWETDPAKIELLRRFLADPESVLEEERNENGSNS
jgi:hypothetical protein